MYEKHSQKFKSIRVSKNLYSFVFELEEDMQKILEASPWSIMNYSMVLQKWEGKYSVDEIAFDTTSLWVRVSGFPRCMFSEKNGVMIGNTIGSTIKVDIRESHFSYLRIRVVIHVNQPLRMGFWLEREASPRKWINLSYEKLGILCYACGIIGHEIGECKSTEA